MFSVYADIQYLYWFCPFVFNCPLVIILSAGLIEMLEGRRGSQGLYMGCMKSGVVISEEYVYLIVRL